MLTTILLVLAAVAVGSQAFLFGGPKWNDLKVTWDFNPFNTWRFDSMPRQESDAIKHKWTLLSDECASAGGSMRGRRYILDGDMSVILLFDMNGFIAGMQTSVPKSVYSPGEKFGAAGPYTNSSDFWLLTAYFIHPAGICDKSKSRTKEQFQSQGTADQVFLQTGSNPETDLMPVPKEENDELKSTKWVKGKCLPSMGRHYWYGVSEDMDCKTAFPYCLLYNSGKFNGFCFAMPANFDNKNKKRFEHPTGNVAKKCCMTPYPKCIGEILGDDALQTTMHVYLDSTPLLNFC